jgi:hypothetical protein
MELGRAYFDSISFTIRKWKPSWKMNKTISSWDSTLTV